MLSWTDQVSQDPCVLYRIYVAEDASRPDDFSAFESAGISTQSSWTHPGAGVDARRYHYLVRATSLAAGDGPLGHYGE